MPNTFHGCGISRVIVFFFSRTKQCYECNRVGDKATHCKYKKKKKKKNGEK